MLDSLVRVSRRVGGATKLLVTEMLTARANSLVIQVNSGTRHPRRQEPRACSQRKQTSPRSTFRKQWFVTSSPGEVQPPAELTEARCPCGSHSPQLPRCQPESPGPSSRAPPFTTAQFHVLLTLSSKFFSIFLHSTCSLSVSGSYLALRGVYHAL
jgi:hypothetical protein